MGNIGKTKLYNTLNFELDCNFEGVEDIFMAIEQARMFMKKHKIAETQLLYNNNLIKVFL